MEALVPTDILGREVKVGDYVAHFSRHGSSMHGRLKKVLLTVAARDPYYQCTVTTLKVRDVVRGYESKIRDYFVVVPPPTEGM